MRRRLFCVGGGVVDGLFDSMDIEPRVRFVLLFGVSSDASLAAIFFSSSRCANDLTEVAPEALPDEAPAVATDEGGGVEMVAEEEANVVLADVLLPVAAADKEAV